MLPTTSAAELGFSRRQLLKDLLMPASSAHYDGLVELRQIATKSRMMPDQILHCGNSKQRWHVKPFATHAQGVKGFVC
jgi:hypothetical protein